MNEDLPTMADYAYAAAGYAKDRLTKAELRIENMERRLQRLEELQAAHSEQDDQ